MRGFIAAMAERRYGNTFTAVLNAVRDQRSASLRIPPVPHSLRLEGRTCLVTGANSGLGKAIATRMASRGARVIMACRSGIPEAGNDVRTQSENDRVEMMAVDLSDFQSMMGFCDSLRDRQVALDVAVFNAGVVPNASRRNKHGLELMFAVNFLAKFVVLDRLLRDGVIPNGAFGRNARVGDPPRVIFVSSETHRGAPAIDFGRFGEPVEYGMTDSVKHYGSSKLHLTTFACELSRRLNSNEAKPEVCVHTLCPGAVNSNMAREAPVWMKPILAPIMTFFFQDPMKAAEPVLHLACSEEMGRSTGAYLHMMRSKQPSEKAMDPRNGELLWSKTEALLREHGVVRGKR